MLASPAHRPRSRPRPASRSSLTASGVPAPAGAVANADGTAASETTATAELEEKLGPPDFINARGVQMMSWTAERSKPGNGILHADGDGILVGRLSSNDLQAGETVMGQVHGLLALRQSAGLRAREILTTTRNSGYLPYEDRVDFAHIADEIAAGRINWVAWRAPERVGRDLLPVLRFYKLLQDTNTDLYLTNLGRRVDWVGDRITLVALGMASEHEGTVIKERTHGALKRRWLEEGRGWPTQIKVGFRRNEHTKFLEVDSEQWPFIKQMHYGYEAAHGTDGLGGLRRLARELHESGFPSASTGCATPCKTRCMSTATGTATTMDSASPAGRSSSTIRSRPTFSRRISSCFVCAKGGTRSRPWARSCSTACGSCTRAAPASSSRSTASRSSRC